MAHFKAKITVFKIFLPANFLQSSLNNVLNQKLQKNNFLISFKLTHILISNQPSKNPNNYKQTDYPLILLDKRAKPNTFQCFLIH